MIKNILYVTDEQYEALYRGETITINGQEYTKNDETAYARDDFEYSRLINKLDDVLIRPNTVYHEQIIMPKVEDLIQVVEYAIEPEVEADKLYYEWGYVILRGTMTNGDYINATPQAQYGSYGTVKIWNNGEWQDMTEDYHCTSNDEELVTLKVMASDYGAFGFANVMMPDDFSFSIKEIGVHYSMFADDFGEVYYNSEVNISNIYKNADKLYIYGYCRIAGHFEKSKINEIKFIDGGIDRIDDWSCFTSLNKVTVPKIGVIGENACKELPIVEFNCPDIGQLKKQAFMGCYDLKNLVLSPINDGYVFYLTKGIKNAVVPDGYPCRLGTYYLSDTYEIESAYIGDGAIMDYWDFRNSAIKKATINCSYITNCFYQTANLQELTLTHNVTTIDGYLMAGNTALKYLFMPNSITSITSANWVGNNGIVTLVLEDGWDCEITLTKYTYGTDQDFLNIINALKDLTGQPAKTITLGTTNKNLINTKKVSLDPETGKYVFDPSGTITAINVANNKNWTVA